jgi:hypothetical protein
MLRGSDESPTMISRPINSTHPQAKLCNTNHSKRRKGSDNRGLRVLNAVDQEHSSRVHNLRSLDLSTRER